MSEVEAPVNWSRYALYDFTETVNLGDVADGIGSVKNIESVEAAWGNGGPTDWSGGFLMKLRDGRWAYATGWNDYTGWGCQDGATVTLFTSRPELAGLAESDIEWDIEPADLNKWIADGYPESGIV